MEAIRKEVFSAVSFLKANFFANNFMKFRQSNLTLQILTLRKSFGDSIAQINFPKRKIVIFSLKYIT